MRLKIPAALVLAVCTGSLIEAGAQTISCRQVAGIKAGIPYAQARKQMLAAGFAPYRIRVYRLVKKPCMGREDICRAYPEAADCAGTGNADCEFLFSKRAGEIVMIHTIGEQLTDLTVQEVRRLTRAQLNKMY